MQRWDSLATETLPWLAHLSNKYRIPITTLQRQLSPSELALEIAVILNDTARLTAQRLAAAAEAEDTDTRNEAERERQAITARKDTLALITLHYLRQLDAERAAREQAESDRQLDQLFRYQESLKQPNG